MRTTLQRVSKEVANKLKNLGFYKRDEGIYEPGDYVSYDLDLTSSRPWKPTKIVATAAPFQEEVAKLFREEHEIYISIDNDWIGSDEMVYSYHIQIVWDVDAKRRCEHVEDIFSLTICPGTYTGGWDTYEEAFNEGILKACDLYEQRSQNKISAN